MWEFIYPISYIGLLLSAAVFFYLKERDLNASAAKRGFWASALFYGLSFFIGDGGMLFSLIGVLTPDIAFLLAVVLIFNRLAPKPRGIYFMLFAVIAGLKVYVIDNKVESVAKGLFQTEQLDLAPNAELLLDIKDHNLKAALNPVLEKYNITMSLAFPDLQHPEYSDLDDYYVLDIPEEFLKDLERIKKELKKIGVSDWIEENELVQAVPIFESDNIVRAKRTDYKVNDPALEKLWGFDAMKVSDLYTYIRTEKIKPSKKAKVAILDTGVEADHEDISANYFSVAKKSDYDKMGHGTHCAGIAGAVSNNGKGIASFAPDNNFIEITSIKVLSDNGWGTQQGILDGITKAADLKMDVISMSLGGPSNDASQRAYGEAMKYAAKAGTVVVVAAGNSNADATGFSPANVEGVITVSAIDENLDRAKFSNTVDNIKMGIAAPGVNIYSSFPKNDYKLLNGTSMATPYVAGLAGMLKAINPELTTEELYQILNNSGKELKDGAETGKLIQPLQALQAASR
jgi:thermitase